MQGVFTRIGRHKRDSRVCELAIRVCEGIEEVVRLNMVTTGDQHHLLISVVCLSPSIPIVK